MNDTSRPTKEQLVRMLREQSIEAARNKEVGRKAISEWRSWASFCCDVELVIDIDLHGVAELGAEWDRQQFIADAIDAINRAQSAWTCCDWTHEKHDTDKRSLVDANDKQIWCEGGDPDCAYCVEVDEDAETAIRLGDYAIKYLENGHIENARLDVSASVCLEEKWGDAPAWGPVKALFATLEE